MTYVPHTESFNLRKIVALALFLYKGAVFIAKPTNSR